MSLFPLDPDHALFTNLAKAPPPWWKNLMADPKIWADVRKKNRINVYYRCGSIMDLGYGRGYRGKIHFEYIPLVESKTHVTYQFDGPNVSIDTAQLAIPSLENFDPDDIKRLKKRIGKFNPGTSEKAIQASFVLANDHFIDTEFQHGKARIDLVWLDVPSKRIVFVELKTIGDDRLYFGEDLNSDNEHIAAQLAKYREFVARHRDELLDYYRRLFAVKKKLGILPEGCSLESIDGFEVEEHPILLVGDATQKWIDRNAPEINERIQGDALGAFYHGKTTRKFRIPDKTTGNKFIFDRRTG